MKLYTTYYYQIRNFPRNLIGLSTAMYPPKYITLGQKDKRGVLVIDCPILKPGEACEGLCNGKCNPKPKYPSDCKFLDTYHTQLMEIDIDKFVKHLQSLHDKICAGEKLNDVDFAFIFFEKYDNPCSERWPLQAWLRYYNIEIQEWNI